MTDIFIDERLPGDIEAGAKARPRYSTDTITTDGGWEVRNSRWRYPLFQFEFNLAPDTRDEDEGLNLNDLDEFLDLFHACGGSFGAFRFHYWRDLPVRGQQIGVGDGSTREFQLYRTYTKGAVSRNRKITRPVVGSVTAYVNNVITVATIDYSTGILTFAGAPALAAVVKADFEHDVPVRFADDELEVIGLTDELDQPVSITLLEIRE
jgi:uncharacterized protein (TIGR02217 family)